MRPFPLTPVLLLNVSDANVDTHALSTPLTLCTWPVMRMIYSCVSNEVPLGAADLSN